MNKTVLLPDFIGVANTGTAICTMTSEVVGGVLESALLKLGGTFTRANITGWRLKADGRVLRASTGADQNSIYTYYGRTNAATEMMIDFMMPLARTPNAYCAGALDLGGVEVSNKITNLTLEVDISGATNPTLKAYAELSPSMDIPSERPVRWVMQRDERNQVTVPAGEFDIAQFIPHFLPSMGGGTFAAIHLFSANVTDIRVRRNGIDEFKFPVAIMQAMQKRAGRVPQSNHLVFDPMTDNMLQGRAYDTTPASGTTKANFFVTSSAPETFWLQTQQFAQLKDF